MGFRVVVIRYELNAVVRAGDSGEFVVSVAPSIRAAFADREKNRTPAA